MTEIALPRTFEEFNDQRKASFIKVHDYKQVSAPTACSSTRMRPTSCAPFPTAI